MLFSLALILMVGMIFGGILRKLHLPSLLGMLLAGMILGPVGFNMIAPEILIISKDLRQIALIIILTQAGLSLDLSDLKKVGRPALMLSFIPATFELVAITILGPIFLGITTLEAALLGAVLAAVSPAVVVPRMLKLMEKGYGKDKQIPQMIMAGASIDDVYVIVIFTALLEMIQGNGFQIMSLLLVPLTIGLGIILGIIAGLILVYIFKRIHVRDTIKVLILLSTSFIFMALESTLKGTIGISGYLAVMAMGVTILERYEPLARRLAVKFSKSWVASELLLFVLVGVAVDFRVLQITGFLALGLILSALIFRMIGVSFCLLGTKLSIKEKWFVSIAYLPKATVQAAIGSVPLSLGLASGNIILSVAIIAILVSAPLGAIGIDLTYRHFLSLKSTKYHKMKEQL